MYRVYLVTKRESDHSINEYQHEILDVLLQLRTRERGSKGRARYESFGGKVKITMMQDGIRTMISVGGIAMVGTAMVRR